MIEFAEFLAIIKGGSSAKEDDGTGAIYQFFKDLTSGSMQIDKHENIPFSLFISTQRRRRILQSMCDSDEQIKKDGERVLNNYKKQLAEKLAREHAENLGEVTSRPSTNNTAKRMGKTVTSNMTAKSKKSQKDSDHQKLIAAKM